MQCILTQGQTTPERILSNPWYDKGFCEPNQYRAALDRCKGGYESCDLFIQIFSDRVRIEREYVAQLEKWATSSIKEISQSKEFGTNKKSWLETIRASKEIGKTHEAMAQRIQETVVDKMVTYKKDNYGKSIVHVKRIKEFERDFEQAQKSWLKLLDRINKAKRDFQDAQRALKKAEAAEKIVESDQGAEEDQKNKAKLSVSTHKKECEALKSKCQQYMDEMRNARPNYESSMKEILDRTHAFERKRLEKFVELFGALHQSMIIDKDPNLKTMSDIFASAVSSHNISEDIKWWNAHYGSDTNTAWPTFEALKD